MARIRTIKPEFTESESVGKLSRDARLLFILLWTIVDDVGRSRASSRFLASRLYPYDDDAVKKIVSWLDELALGQHVRLYEVDGDSYLDIPKWLDHQKIDHPAKSRLPEFRAILAKPSEDFARDPETFAPHTLDLVPVPRTMDLGPRTGEGADAPPPLDEAVAVFNETAERVEWSKVQRLSPARRTALKNRLAECGGVEGWQTAMAKAEASNFLTGKTPRTNGHANWRPDFDWFTTASNFTKLMEGSYDNPRNIQRQPVPERGIGAALAALAD